MNLVTLWGGALLKSRMCQHFILASIFRCRYKVPELQHSQARQYSLSDELSPYYYCINVKKEDGLNPAEKSAGAHHAYISSLLPNSFNKGDTVKPCYPDGDSFL